MALKVIVGGGSGFLGQAVVKLLKNKGYLVSMVSRRGGDADTITWENIRNRGFPAEIHAVVNVSGAPLVDPRRRWNDECKKEVCDSRIETNRWLKKAILSSEIKPRAWVTISGVGYYTTSLTNVYDEDSPGGNQGFLANLARDWEAAGELPSDCKGVRHVIIRSGAVLGKEGGVIKNMMWPFWMGLGGPIGSGMQAFPWIHLDDLAGIFLHAIENENVAGVLNGVAPASDTNETFSKAFGRALHRPAFLRVPGFAINLMLGKDRAPVLLEGQNVTPRRTIDSGYKFVYTDIDMALASIVS